MLPGGSGVAAVYISYAKYHIHHKAHNMGILAFVYQ
jgi:hypothetical protein